MLIIECETGETLARTCSEKRLLRKLKYEPRIRNFKAMENEKLCMVIVDDELVNVEYRRLKSFRIDGSNVKFFTS